MKKVEVYYTIENDGAGSVYLRWFLTEELAEKYEEEMEQGWGEPSVGYVETFIGSNIHTEALENV